MKSYFIVISDECSQNNGGCSHICKNTVTGYLCSCPNNLVLGVDKHYCYNRNGMTYNVLLSNNNLNCIELQNVTLDASMMICDWGIYQYTRCQIQIVVHNLNV